MIMVVLTAHNVGSIPNISQANHVPESPIEGLPPEIKVEILRNSPDTKTLQALAHASYFYFQAYKPVCQKIFREVLIRELKGYGHNIECRSFFEIDISEHARQAGILQRDIKICYQRARNAEYHKPSIKHSLALPVMKLFAECSFAWRCDRRRIVVHYDTIKDLFPKLGLHPNIGSLITKGFFATLKSSQRQRGPTGLPLSYLVMVQSRLRGHWRTRSPGTSKGIMLKDSHRRNLAVE